MSWENKVLSDISISIQTGPFGSQLIILRLELQL